MYDTYSRYIYEWLIKNDIATKIDSIVSLLTDLKSASMYIFIIVCFLLFVTIALKFITVRGRNI